MKIKIGMKKAWSMLLLALIALVLVGCSDNQAKVYAEKLYIANHDGITGSFALPKYVEGNKDVPVTWESSHPNIVSIGEYPDWERPSEEDTLLPSPELYYKATVVLPTEETEVTLKATVTFEGKEATRDMKITVVADEYEAMTIEEAKDAESDTKVKIEGTVVFVADKGYAVKDDTGYMYMYVSGHGRKIGDQVVVRGVKDVYNMMPQLSDSTAEKVGEEEEGFDPYKDIEEITIDELIAHPKEDADFYTKLYKIKGKIYSSDDSYNPYRITDPLDTETYVNITKYTSSDSLEDIKQFEQKYVEMVILIYSNYRDAYSVCYVENTAEETEIVYTDKQKASITLQKMVALVEDEVLTWDINLPTTDSEFNATVAWESSNEDILANDGTVNAPDTETTVKLTIKVTVGSETVEETVELKAVKLNISKTNDLIEKAPLNDDDEEMLVLVEGKVIGYQYGGYWVFDDTGAILIYSKKRPNLDSIVQVKGYLTAHKPDQSFNMQIEPVEYKVLSEAEAPQIPEAINMTIGDIFALGVNSQEKAVEVAKDYYGKFITIEGKVRGSGYYWYIDGDQDQWFRLNNLESSNGLKEGDEVKITVMVRDIYYVDDTSGYDNYKAGTFGGVFFGENAIVVK